VPRGLTGVAHSRSPIVPFGSTSLVFPTKTILFAADDAGDVHSFDAETGTPLWAPPARPSSNATITGAPGAILTQYAGIRDLVLVGTRNTNPSNPSDFFGLDVATGATVSAFNGTGTLGPVSGTPAIDYGAQRAYFASRKRLGSGDTVWALNVNLNAPVLTAAWSRDYGEFDTSPVLRGGRLYLGNTAGLVHSIDAATGDGLRTFTPTPPDGPVKGFVFPDRRNDDIIFATDTKVWSVSDDGTSTMTKNWEWTVAGLNPSMVLYWPQTNLVYVGSKDGKLYELDFTSANPSPPTHKPPLVLGDGLGQIGAPSLDIGVDLGGGKRLLVVGSESGVLYGVEVPFP
jgi:outer membrane protein assembly factor BamB